MAVAAVLEKAKTTTKGKATTKGRKAIKGAATSRIPAKDQKKLDSYELVEINGATYSFEVKWTRHVKANLQRGIAAKPKRQYKLYNFCPIGGIEAMKSKLEGIQKLGYADEIGWVDFELETKRIKYGSADRGLYHATIKLPKDGWALADPLTEVFKLDITTKAQEALKSSLIFNWCLENLTDVTYGEMEIKSSNYNYRVYNFVHYPIIGYNNIEVGMIAFTVMDDLTLGNGRVSLYNKAVHHLV